ncbi:hypothetical protein E2C01_005886 [Portunus trituberculatus]|uniref:Uncharacterized protein n=1 Tax=Portunus trituberculatus TaxID=210409 RepID=A0A5B7CVL7_PORTR|nr:hypothetical protein [Portunus trituberculatus]
MVFGKEELPCVAERPTVDVCVCVSCLHWPHHRHKKTLICSRTKVGHSGHERNAATGLNLQAGHPWGPRDKHLTIRPGQSPWLGWVLVRPDCLSCHYTYAHSYLLPPGLGLDGPASALPFPSQRAAALSLSAASYVQCSAFLHTAVPLTLSLSPSRPWPALLLQPASLGIGDGAPQLKDEVISEPKCFQVRIIHRLGKLHRVLLLLTQLPDLGRCKEEKRDDATMLRGKCHPF